MKISLVCSDPGHPIRPWLESWVATHNGRHQIELVNKVAALQGGDLLFLISCHEIVARHTRQMYDATLVIHASDLPRGRGWSPHIWQILEGRNDITVTLLEAEDNVDSGAIWAQRVLHFSGDELYDEINRKLFEAEIFLMSKAIDDFSQIDPRPQDGVEATYYPKRNPEDSRIDPQRSIAEQFDLLRVADPQRFPAFFDWRGYRYELHLRKTKETPND
jgi:methionyl-tRNA formyltransferase